MRETMGIPSTEILAENHSGKTRIYFTRKALFHILQEHSEVLGTQKARDLGKICFSGEQEICSLGDLILQSLPSYLERYRVEGGGRLTENPRNNLISHLYVPESKDLIVQLKYLKPDTFEIVSFYKKRDLKAKIKP